MWRPDPVSFCFTEEFYEVNDCSWVVPELNEHDALGVYL
jgi:hypothetical protein